MKKSQITYIKNILLPCLVYSGLTGIFTGCLIFIFKLAVSKVVPLSQGIYALVRETPAFLPLLLLGATAVGSLAALILRFATDCKGGGIPTAITLLRGLVSFNWVKSIFLLFPSALLTYFCGVPLGTEGPSVQMGTAVGRGTVRIFVKKHLAWDRYIMTGGASAGFAAATGAPLTGIFFAFEEAHKRFSPMLFMVSAVSAVTSTAVMQFLCPHVGISPTLFHFEIDAVLPLSLLWAAIIVGIVCGFVGALFTKIYSIIHNFIDSKLSKLPLTAKIITVFAATAVIGFFMKDCLGSGDLLIEELIEGHGSWKMLIVYFCIRAVMLIIANNIGVTGGLFVPTLCFGAIIGGLCGNAMTALGILPEEYYVITVVIGISSFLAASSRTPIMATAFAVEALSGLSNIVPIIAGVSIAYITVETLGIHDFTDIVIGGKLKAARKGKKEKTVDIQLTVEEGAFAEGKEIRDILWPPTCTVLSVHKNPTTHHHSHTSLAAGDEIHVHYQTYEPEETLKSLEAIIGEQKIK